MDQLVFKYCSQHLADNGDKIASLAQLFMPVGRMAKKLATLRHNYRLLGMDAINPSKILDRKTKHSIYNKVMLQGKRPSLKNLLGARDDQNVLGALDTAFYSKLASSSRVTSPHAFYNPPTMQNMTPPMPLDQGNKDVIQGQIKPPMQLELVQPPPPSVQPNTPMVPKPFSPKYTGM